MVETLFKSGLNGLITTATLNCILCAFADMMEQLKCNAVVMPRWRIEGFTKSRAGL